MNASEIKAHYEQEISQAETQMEKNLLKAEMNHKIKLLDLDDEIKDKKAGEDSEFECIGCGS